MYVEELSVVLGTKLGAIKENSLLLASTQGRTKLKKYCELIPHDPKHPHMCVCPCVCMCMCAVFMSMCMLCLRAPQCWCLYTEVCVCVCLCACMRVFSQRY